MSPANDNDACPSCGSSALQWQQDNGWVTRPVRYLRCTMCGDSVRTELPGWAWIMYLIALAAAVWGFVSVMG
jgi:hypothetical protein